MIEVQHSVVNPDALLKSLNRQYPSIGAVSCDLLELGCNDNYRVKGKRQDYVFRLYRLNWWPVKEIDEELRMLEVMHRNKLNVCKPVRNKKKQRYIKINAPEGIRFVRCLILYPANTWVLTLAREIRSLYNWATALPSFTGLLIR